MIIANPIYDVTFKKLMENNRVARYLLGTILKCDIISLEQSATEYTVDPEELPELSEKLPAITLTRMDYAAVIRTKDGAEKEVLIEVQKTLNKGDIVRFRRYLATKYKNSELELISIYILGFNLDVESPAFIARPDCHDLLTDEIILTDDKFVKDLTHTAYFIQTLRIEASERSPLHKVLSIFEQRHFVNGGTYNKTIKYATIEPDLKELVDVLQYVAGDETLQAELEKEEYNTQWLDDYFGDRDRREADLVLTIEESKKALEESKKDLEESKKDLEESKKDLEESKKDLEESKKDLEEKNKALVSTVKILVQIGMSVEKIAEITGLETPQVEKMINGISL